MLEFKAISTNVMCRSVAEMVFEGVRRFRSGLRRGQTLRIPPPHELQSTIMSIL